jgi:hypothetical protein
MFSHYSVKDRIVSMSIGQINKIKENVDNFSDL